MWEFFDHFFVGWDPIYKLSLVIIILLFILCLYYLTGAYKITVEFSWIKINKDIGNDNFGRTSNQTDNSTD